MDYYYAVAISQYEKNKKFAHNYEVVKGIINKADFYEEPVLGDFAEMMLGDEEMPPFVQHYSILAQPLNSVVGEMTKRPDNFIFKDFSADGQSEELEYKTELMNQYVQQKVYAMVSDKLARQGVDIQTEEGAQQFTQMADEELLENISTYTSQAEKWANRMIEALRMEFNIKELSEEAFRDLWICGRERFHIYEDNSKLGFGTETVNPVNTWKLSIHDKKYTKQSYAAGIIELMEISEILNKYVLTKEEVDHLRKLNQENHLISGSESNLFSGKTGLNSVTYDTYNPAKLDERLRQEAFLEEGKRELDSFLGITHNTDYHGEKFVVVTAYFEAKKKIGKLTYIDEDGLEQITLVDENYKNNSHPGQITIEWGYINQWYKGLRIGPELYFMEPLKILDYCPIIGVDFEPRNADVKSPTDAMMPFQALFNLAINQLWKILQKEKGMIASVNIRKIPVPEGADQADALSIWEEEATERGVMFEDDSPENTKVPTSNTSITRAVDLSRTNEIQSRYTLAAWCREQAWDMVGFNRQRAGNVLASETATGTETALAQSYAQTEPIFIQHEYVMQQYIQALVDAAQYVESQKDFSTISYVTSVGESVFLQVAGHTLKNKDIRVYATSRAEDQENLRQLKGLAQTLIQGGADIHSIATLFTTKSTRLIEETFKKVAKYKQEFEQRQQQIQEQELQAQQEGLAAQIQQQQIKDQLDRENENYNKELDRINKKEVALIQASARNENATQDLDNNGIADALEVARLDSDIAAANQEHSLKQAKIMQDSIMQQQKIIKEQEALKLQKEKEEADRKLKTRELDIKEKQIDTQLKIAKTNKNKFDSKKS